MKKNLVKLLSICQEFQDKSKSRLWLKDKLREAIAPLDLFIQKEKAELYRTAFNLAVAGTPSKVMIGAGGKASTVPGTDYSDPATCKELVQKMGTLERHAGARERAVESKEQLQRGREKRAIFYVCSKHVSPAKDHKDWQGKLYVDRYWRATLKSSTTTEWMIPLVEKYIADHDIKTIQWVMGPPVWLTTRPYCKHWFAPVLTSTVLTREPSFYTPVTHGKKTKRGATYEYIKKNLAKR